jgi:Mg-chelatase subunit ChlI
MADNATPSRKPKLLKPAEVTACKTLAADNLADSPRAVALLAIHQGATQAQAAESSGLTLGQVKYIVTRFRRLRMAALNTENADKVSDTQGSARNSTSNKKKKAKDKDKKAKKKQKKEKNKKDKDKNKDKAKKNKKDKKKKNKQKK